MKNSHQNIADNLHLSGVVFVGIMNLPKYVYNSQSGVAMLDHLSQPGSIHVVQYVDGEFHVFGMDRVKLTAEVDL